MFVQPAAIASGTARERTDRIKLGLGALEAELQAAIDDELWLELGYEKFADWWHGEGFEGFRLQGTLYDWAARQLKADYPDMGPKAIGAALGSSRAEAARSLTVSDETEDDHQDVDVRLPGEQPLPLDPEPSFETRPAVRPIWSVEEYALLDRLRSGEAVVASLRGQHDNLIAWAQREDRYVRIDRRTDWGNPFEMPADGDRATVIANYRDHYLPHKPGLLASLPDLRGKVLGCWCTPEACHGDVLKAWAEE